MYPILFSKFSYILQNIVIGRGKNSELRLLLWDFLTFTCTVKHANFLIYSSLRKLDTELEHFVVLFSWALIILCNGAPKPEACWSDRS